MDSIGAEDFEDVFFCFKLVSGDTVVCQVIQDSDKTVIVRDPFQILAHTRTDGDSIKTMNYYVEWFAGAENRVHMIRKDHILSAAIPSKELRAEYTRLVKKKIERTLSKVKKPAPKNTDWTGLDYDLGEGFSRN